MPGIFDVYKRAHRAKKVANMQLPEYFSYVPATMFDWWRVPLEVKHWEHRSGSFLYNNDIWTGDHTFSEGFLRFEYVDGNDHTVYEFGQICTPKFYNLRVLFDPGLSGVPFLVYRDEWDKATTLDPDYIYNRRYWT